MKATDTRTTLNLSTDMAEAVDDYWHKERLGSRNAAIRELLTYALFVKRYGTVPAPAKEKRK